MLWRSWRASCEGSIPAIYHHTLNRGDRRESMFKAAADRRRLVGQRAMGDKEKLTIAARLRQGTVGGIARRLQMARVANVNPLLYQWGQAKSRK